MQDLAIVYKTKIKLWVTLCDRKSTTASFPLQKSIVHSLKRTV